MPDVKYWLSQGITSYGAMQMLEEAYYLGLSPKPMAALTTLKDYIDPNKRIQYLARLQGIFDGNAELMKIKQGENDFRGNDLT